MCCSHGKRCTYASIDVVAGTHVYTDVSIAIGDEVNALVAVGNEAATCEKAHAPISSDGEAKAPVPATDEERAHVSAGDEVDTHEESNAPITAGDEAGADSDMHSSDDVPVAERECTCTLASSLNLCMQP